MLGYLSKGGISYGDTELMTPHERKIALDTLKEIIDSQNNAHRQAIEEAKNAQRNSTPKSGLSH